jgi:hypothetical protein
LEQFNPDLSKTTNSPRLKTTRNNWRQILAACGDSMIFGEASPTNPNVKNLLKVASLKRNHITTTNNHTTMNLSKSLTIRNTNQQITTTINTTSATTSTKHATINITNVMISMTNATLKIAATRQRKFLIKPGLMEELSAILTTTLMKLKKLLILSLHVSMDAAQGVVHTPAAREIVTMLADSGANSADATNRKKRDAP